jgi:hypothetical protein
LIAVGEESCVLFQFAPVESLVGARVYPNVNMKASAQPCAWVALVAVVAVLTLAAQSGGRTIDVGSPAWEPAGAAPDLGTPEAGSAAAAWA